MKRRENGEDVCGCWGVEMAEGKGEEFGQKKGLSAEFCLNQLGDKGVKEKEEEKERCLGC